MVDDEAESGRDSIIQSIIGLTEEFAFHSK